MIGGAAVAAAAYAGRYGIKAWQAFKARPPSARLRKFYDGGFQPTMTRREAALILGVRYQVAFILKYESILCLSHEMWIGIEYMLATINVLYCVDDRNFPLLMFPQI